MGFKREKNDHEIELKTKEEKMGGLRREEKAYTRDEIRRQFPTASTEVGRNHKEGREIIIQYLCGVVEQSSKSCAR